MKKYRLLKDTPEVDKGAVFIKKNNAHTTTGYCLVDENLYKGVLASIDFYYMPESLVEGNAEWFEEVVESSGEIKTMTDRQIRINEILNGFVDRFQVDNEKCVITTRQCDVDYTIKQIESLSPEKRVEKLEKGQATLNVFCTEDGFDCADGERVYGVIIHASGPDQWREHVLPFVTPGNRGRKWFKDKEAASEYLIRNKKAFSLNDVLSYIEDVIKTKSDYMNVEELLRRVAKAHI